MQVDVTTICYQSYQNHISYKSYFLIILNAIQRHSLI